MSPGTSKKGKMMKLSQRCGWIVLTVAVILIAGTGQVGAAIPTAERNALIDLYNSTDGANWTVNTNWLGAVGTECTWERVFCNVEETSVERILLYNHYLVGTLPDSLPDLTNLLVLDLSGNYLSGSIPTSFGSFVSLIQLILDENDLDGSIPTALGNATTLQWINLYDNELTGSIPASLGDLTFLNFLGLDNNELSGSIPASLGGLSNLEALYLWSNDLTGSIPTELGDLSSLRILWLNYNQLSGSIPTSLGSLSNLTNLDLEGNELTGSIPASLGDLSSLIDLDLSLNQLSGTIPAVLGDLPDLTNLYLGWNQLTGSIPPELGQLSNLTRLGLSDNQLTGSIPPELGSLSSLEALFLGRNQLSGPIPSELGDLSAMYVVWLNSNKFVGELPMSLMNLNVTGHIDYNGVYTSDPSLIAYLNQYFGTGWAATQTVAPENLVVTGVSDHTVWLSWDAVSYADLGGYNVYVAPAGSGSWTLADWTSYKTTTLFPVSGLDPDTPYDFVVASFTDPHASNVNLVVSDSGASVMATTSNGGCAQPVIQSSWGSQVTLSVSGSYDTYQWSAGGTTPTTDVATPTSPRWYWVTVTSPGSCEETATVLLDPATVVFLDDFETGDTSGWTSSTP